MPKVPLPGTSATECAWYTSLRMREMSFITPWKLRDMWLSARSVYTTENSSRPSGSMLGSSPGMVLSRNR